MNGRLRAGILLAVVTLLSLLLPSRVTAPYTGRRQIMLVDPSAQEAFTETDAVFKTASV